MKRKIFSLLLCVTMIFSYATQVMAAQDYDLDFAISENLVKSDTTTENMPQLSLEYMITNDNGVTYVQGGSNLPVVNTSTTGTAATDFYVGVKANNFKQFYWMEGPDRTNYGIFQFAVGVSYDPEYIVPEPQNRQEVFGSVVYSNEYNTMKTRMATYAASPWKAMGIDLYEPTSSSSVNINKSTVYVNMSMVSTYIDMTAAPMAVIDNDYLMFFKFRLIKEPPAGTNVFDFFALTDPTNTTSSVVMSFGSKGGHNVTYNNETTQLQKYLALDTSNVDAMYPPESKKHNVTISAAANGSVAVKQGNTAVTAEPAGNVYALEEGKSYTVTPSPSSGYRFKDWTITGDTEGWVTKDATSNKLTITVPANAAAIPTITANFEEDVYYISVTAGANGSVAVKQGNTAVTAEPTSSANAGKYKIGRSGTYTATATASDHYKFSAWSGGSTAATATLTITEAMAASGLTANFVAKTAPTMSAAQKAGKSVNAASPADVNIQYTPNDYPFDSANSNVKSVTLTKSGTDTALTFGSGAGKWNKSSGTNSFVIYGANFSGVKAGDDVKVTIVMNDAASTKFEIPIEITDSTPKVKSVTAVTLPTKSTYTYGDAISLVGMTVTVEEKQGSNVLGTTTHTYGASGWNTDPGVTLKVNNKALTNGMTTLTVADSKPIVASLGTSTATSEGSLTIDKKTVDVAISGKVSKVYAGPTNKVMPSTAALTATVTGATGITATVNTTGVNFPISDVSDSGATITGFTAANITLSDKNNYAVGNVTSTATAEVTPKSLEVSIQKPSTQKDGNTEVDITAAVSLKGVIGEEDVSLAPVKAVFTDVSTPGDQTVRIVYSDPNPLTGTRASNYTLTKTESCTGTVQDYHVIKLEIKHDPVTSGYTNGEHLDHTGMIVEETRSNGAVITYTWNTANNDWDVTGGPNDGKSIRALSDEGIVSAWVDPDAPDNAIDTGFNADGVYHTLYRTEHENKCLRLLAKDENGVWKPSNKTAAFSIGKQRVDVTISGSMSKVYDGTNSVEGATISVQGDVTTTVSDAYPVSVLNIDQTNFRFPSANVGTSTYAVGASAIKLSDDYNYEVGTVTGSVDTNISQLTINVTVNSVPNYVIGESNVVTVTDYILEPEMIAGDDVTLSVTGTYPSSASAGTATVAIAVNATGDQAENYNFIADETATGIVTGDAPARPVIGGGGGGATKYTVTFNVGKNGAITTGSKTYSVTKGGVLTEVPTVEADEGYEFKGWSLDGETVVDPTSAKVTKSITYVAVYGEKEIDHSIIDVKYDKPYATGYVDGSFRPNNNITRAELATMIARLINKGDITEYRGNSFKDAQGDWYTKYIGYLEDKNILNGYEDGTFQPNKTITRGEVCAVIARAQGFAIVTGDSDFSDVTDAYWGKDYVNTLAAKKIITGYADGTFGAQSPITRAETVTIINRLLDPSTAVVTFTPSDVKGHWAEDAIMLAVNEREVNAAEDDKEAADDDKAAADDKKAAEEDKEAAEDDKKAAEDDKADEGANDNSDEGEDDAE